MALHSRPCKRRNGNKDYAARHDSEQLVIHPRFPSHVTMCMRRGKGREGKDALSLPLLASRHIRAGGNCQLAYHTQGVCSETKSKATHALSKNEEKNCSETARDAPRPDVVLLQEVVTGKVA